MTTFELITLLFGAAALFGGGMAVAWKCAEFVYRARETEKQCHAEKEAREKNDERIKELLAEASELASVVVNGSFLFAKHDPSPQFPLCPVCYADGKKIRMLRAGTVNPVTVQTLQMYNSIGLMEDAQKFIRNNRKGFCCSRCNTHIFVTEAEAKILKDAYGIDFP